MLLFHPLAASKLFDCHIHSLQALNKDIFSRFGGFIPPPAAALREYYGLTDTKSISREVGAGGATSIKYSLHRTESA